MLDRLASISTVVFLPLPSLVTPCGRHVTRHVTAVCIFPPEEEAKGLCHVLTQVCPRPKPQMWDLSLETRNHWMEIDKSEITMKRELGSGNFGEVWYGKSQHRQLLCLRRSE